jgi:hydrogenase-4 transcriptional activator
MNQRALKSNNSFHETNRRLEEKEQELQALHLENAQLKRKVGRADEMESIIGENAGLKETMDLVRKAAPTDVSVLLLGETGAGKEVIAKAVHSLSLRCQGPFLRVNCGAIPPELIDSELFGHEKGSFTGAENLRIGVFEAANQGTLFLDEIGEMPEEAQLRLLRVLQDGVIQRVGGSRGIKVDVRVVLATHRDLRQLIEVGRFRQDLWFRISTFPIKIPPLRSRPTDIENLIRHFLKKAGIRFGMKVPPLTAQDIQTLRDYSWPGNIRELAAVLDRALLLSNGESLEVRKALGQENEKLLPTLKTLPPSQVEGEGLMEKTIRSTIESALRQSKGRIQGPFGAALRLGLNPGTLRYKLKVLKIKAQNFKD